MPEKVRVAAVDDHPVMLEGLRSALARGGGDVVLVETATRVSDLSGLSPPAQVVLLDLNLNDGSRPGDNVRALMSLGCRVLVYTDGARSSWIADAVAAGAAGVVLKGQPVHTLMEAIRTVRDGATWFSPELAAAIHVVRPRLAPREVEVLQLVARGLASKQVANRLGIKEETVKEYLKRIRTKYDDLGRSASTRVHLLQRAREDGFLDDAARD